MKKRTHTAYPEDFARACGIKNIRVIDPLDFGQTLRVLKEEVRKKAASVIISRRACILIEKPKKGPWTIDPDRCTQCGRCLKVGCPAIYKERANEKVILIDEVLCTGCGFCAQACPKGAIVPKG
ncbi:MAG: 4Fe-4S dicluster domain-containing protein [Firmicutes bacterium]|nr:4Fe-4S dicluster domain-containing protein [Bacillota bacterium]